MIKLLSLPWLSMTAAVSSSSEQLFLRFRFSIKSAVTLGAPVKLIPIYFIKVISK